MSDLINRKEVKAIRKSYTQLGKHLTQEEVDLVINSIGFKVEHRAAEFFDVHVTTYRRWIHGRSKPCGRSKLVFNVILNMIQE